MLDREHQGWNCQRRAGSDEGERHEHQILDGAVVDRSPSPGVFVHRPRTCEAMIDG
jgi:hypothetical protein